MPGLVSQSDLAVNLSRSSLVCHVHRERSSKGGKNAVLSDRQTPSRNALLSSNILPTCVGWTSSNRSNKMHILGLHDQ